MCTICTRIITCAPFEIAFFMQSLLMQHKSKFVKDENKDNLPWTGSARSSHEGTVEKSTRWQWHVNPRKAGHDMRQNILSVQAPTQHLDQSSEENMSLRHSSTHVSFGLIATRVLDVLPEFSDTTATSLSLERMSSKYRVASCQI